MKLIQNKDVQDAIEEAAKIACERLDQVFPGADKGGISSSFQGTLVKCLNNMLMGNDPYRCSHLKQLAFDEFSLGIETEGHDQGYVVVRKSDMKALSLYNKFVSLDRDTVEVMSTFKDACSLAAKLLDTPNCEFEHYEIGVVPVYYSGHESYSFAPCNDQAAG